MSWELGYIAGFFDGEGCVSAQVNKHGYSAVHVRLGQKFPDPLEFVQLHFGGNIRQYGDMYYVEWSGRSALPILEAMLPYLIVKRRQVELAIEWCNLSSGRGTVGIGRPQNEAVKVRRLEIVSEIKAAKAVVLCRGMST